MYIEEFQDYRRDCWWWFVTYLELGSAISANPELSAKNTDFSKMISEYQRAAQELEVQKKRSVLFGRND